MHVLSIDQMPNLAARLGKAGVAKIKYLDKPERQRTRRERITLNTAFQVLQAYRFTGLPQNQQDVIIGACRAVSDGNRSLSPDNLLAILQCLENLSTHEIQYFLDCSEATARKYMQACKITLPFITRTN